MCKLNPDARLRVCTLVLSAEYFDKGLLFTPKYEYIENSECIQREIAFQDDNVNSEATEEIYKEWMISCKVDNYKRPDFHGEYFLSRVYGSNDEVFGFHSGQNSRVVIDNLFGDVRFVI